MKTIIKRTYKSNVDAEKVVQDLLEDRNIKDPQAFLHPEHPTNIPFESFFPHKDSFRDDWKRTLSLLKDIHEAEKNIVVYSDYDADGVTGGAIMWEALHKLGFKVMPYIPERKEGYGFSKEGLDTVIEKYDPALIISVDHGIVAHKEIEYAHSKGVPVIITDHHHKQDTTPEHAFAIFHTDAISGSGVAYFFAKELINEMTHVQNHDHLKYMARTDYMGLAAIGTIADLVPLIGPSRAIARYGLPTLGLSSRLGLRSLMRESRVEAPVTAYHVGFMIAPRINAFGRLDHAMDALRLLCTTSMERADELTKKAQSVNQSRQKRVQDAMKEAESQVDHDQKIIVIESADWEEGIIGLIAGKLLQKYYKPTIVLSRDAHESKASVRSVDDVHITNFLAELKDYLIDMGGHAAAAGFSISNDAIEDFKTAAYELAHNQISEDMLLQKQYVDIAMPYGMIDLKLIEAVEELGPFGMGFKKPLFMSEMPVMNMRTMGKTDKHIKFQVGDGIRGLDLIAFNADSDLHNTSHGDILKAVFTLDINEWNGRRSPQAILKQTVLD